MSAQSAPKNGKSAAASKGRAVAPAPKNAGLTPAERDTEDAAALVELLNLEPVAFARLLRKAALAGGYGRRPSAVQFVRKAVLDVAMKMNEPTAVRNVRSMYGADGC